MMVSRHARSDASPGPRGRGKRRLVALLAAWLLLVAVPPLGLWAVRDDWLAEQNRPAAQREWEAFRQDMQQASEEGWPVKRKVPKSPEPPLRVWLRDYFGLAVAAWVLFGSVLVLFTGFLVTGVAASPGGPATINGPESASPPPPR